MISISLAFFVCLFGVANAHFRLLYPGPRGAFVADNEPQFCGGHTEVTTNRTTFPLSGGFFNLRTSHAGFTVGVLLSTDENPNTFDKFNANGAQQLVHQFSKEPGAGTFCIPLNISAAGIAGVGEGSNVTIQVVFEGGDGALYQCADLTLSANLTTPPSDVTCSNATATTTGTSPTSTQTGASVGLKHQLSAYAAGFLGLMGAIFALA